MDVLLSLILFTIDFEILLRAIRKTRLKRGVKIGRMTSNYNSSLSNDLFNLHIFSHKHKVEGASGGKVKL